MVSIDDCQQCAGMEQPGELPPLPLGRAEQVHPLALGTLTHATKDAHNLLLPLLLRFVRGQAARSTDWPWSCGLVESGTAPAPLKSLLPPAAVLGRHWLTLAAPLAAAMLTLSCRLLHAFLRAELPNESHAMYAGIGDSSDDNLR